jgi:hypothetical protein
MNGLPRQALTSVDDVMECSILGFHAHSDHPPFIIRRGVSFRHETWREPFNVSRRPKRRVSEGHQFIWEQTSILVCLSSASHNRDQ